MAVTHLADVPTADVPTVDLPIADGTMPAADEPAPVPRNTLAPGAKVEVRRRLDDKWARGFEVLEVSAAGYRLRRLSDGVEIPATFADGDIRKERKRDTWWY